MNKDEISKQIKEWGEKLGFQQIGITSTCLKEDEKYLFKWLKTGWHGNMKYMLQHGTKRSRPFELIPKTLKIISVRMDYYPPSSKKASSVLRNKQLAYISRYALGKDYHKLIRKRLQKLAYKIESYYGKYNYRCFVDSAPVLEKALARNAGLGWIGKHTNLINPKAGSWFFIGEIYTDLPLQDDLAFNNNHCGTCNSCMDICPTSAIIAPMRLDARRCISYLTIELKTSIPTEFRKMIGNRVYGCDDCQLICPWNKFAKNTKEDSFHVKNGLDAKTLLSVFKWSKEEFLQKTEGSAIRRIGYDRWLRNIAVALGNTKTNKEVINSLIARRKDPSKLVSEHVKWAIKQHIKN